MQLPLPGFYRSLMDELSYPLRASRSGTSAAVPEPSDLPLVRSLLSISKSTRAFLTLMLAEIDLHLGQDQLVAGLEPGRAISVSELADRIAVRPSTVSKMLDRLVDKNLVQRTVSSEDARRTMVVLTQAGLEIRPRVEAVWARLEKELAGAMTVEEADTLATAMNRMETLLATKLRRHR